MHNYYILIIRCIAGIKFAGAPGAGLPSGGVQPLQLPFIPLSAASLQLYIRRQLLTFDTD